MLDKLIGGHGFGHKEHRSSGFGFQEHKEFASHEESQGGFFDRQNNFGHMRLPANHGRPPMARMPVCDEEDSDSDVEDYVRHIFFQRCLKPFPPPPPKNMA
ncbi:unnamed protein product [Arabis nemorensis]|uniref:Uncharacterized protein n=1 Tax=Arabis nemorensis TaxID=586526 RepID=A0A565AZZ1_9BRAS|nr:unnamed protein product [Arabis nemorensis]